MKKLFNIAALLMISGIYNTVVAQDQIETNGGHTYEVKILEETDSYVEFYFLHDEDKEVRKMSTQNISKIVKNAWDAATKNDEAKVEQSSSKTVESKSDIKSATTENTKKSDATITASKGSSNTAAKPVATKPEANKPTSKSPDSGTAKKPIQVKEENDIKCLYSLENATNKTTKSLYYGSVNINSAPIALLKKFTLKSVIGVKEGDKMYLVFKILGASNFSMKAKNKILIKLTNGSVVDLYNTSFTTAEYNSRYEADFKIEVPEFHLSDLIEHKSLRFRFILDNGYIEFTNSARTSHWISRALLCIS